MRQILETFKTICKTFEKTLIKLDKYIEMLENLSREFREILERLKLYLENFRKDEKFLLNLNNSFNDSVSFKKNLL